MEWSSDGLPAAGPAYGLQIDRDIQAQARMTRDPFAPAAGDSAGDNQAEVGSKANASAPTRPDSASPAPRNARSRLATLLIVGAGVLIAAIAFGTAAMVLDFHKEAALLIAAAGFVILAVAALVALLVRQLARDQ